MEQLIRELEEYAERNFGIAQETRTKEAKKSFFFWKIGDLMKRAAEALGRNIPQEKETEGGGSTWFLVCPECHGAVDPKDNFCRCCGQALKN